MFCLFKKTSGSLGSIQEESSWRWWWSSSSSSSKEKRRAQRVCGSFRHVPTQWNVPSYLTNVQGQIHIDIFMKHIHCFSFVLRDTWNLFLTRYTLYTAVLWVICFFHEHCKFVQGCKRYSFLFSSSSSSSLIPSHPILSLFKWIQNSFFLLLTSILLFHVRCAMRFLIFSWHTFVVYLFIVWEKKVVIFLVFINKFFFSWW